MDQSHTAGSVSLWFFAQAFMCLAFISLRSVEGGHVTNKGDIAMAKEKMLQDMCP